MSYKPCFLRGYNNYSVKAASDEASSVNDEPSLTQQHFKDDCDINVIVERFGLTGALPQNVRAPMYGDFTGVSDYQSALHQIMAAEDSFMQMAPTVRLKFDNDPGKFVDFCSDPANIDAMREMGLAVKKEVPNVKSGERDGSVGASGSGKVGAPGPGVGGDEAAARGSSRGSGPGGGGD